MVLRELSTRERFELTFEAGRLYVFPNESWVVEALSLNVGHYQRTKKDAFSMGPYRGHMRCFWRQRKPNRCKAVEKLRATLRETKDDADENLQRAMNELVEARMDADALRLQKKEACKDADIFRAQRDEARKRAQELGERLQSQDERKRARKA